MKKVLRSTVLSMLCLLVVLPLFGFSKAEAAQTNTNFAKADLREMKEALKKSNLQVDLENGTNAEKVVKNDKGEEIGRLGIEEVASQTVIADIPDPGQISALSTTALPTGVYKTFKVYWYAATVNYHFYTQVYRSTSTGLGQIVDAYDQWYAVIPPGYVSRDTLAITRKYETSSLPAEAKYSLNFTAPYSTVLYIYGRVKSGNFITGGN